MTPHRWIRRKDGTVDLYIAGMIVGRITTQHGARTVYWQGGYSGGPAASKAEAKRLVLRAVLAPRVKGEAKAAAVATSILWSEFRVNDLCGLCGNRGVIDARAQRAPSGAACGALHYCICPNGRALKAQGADRAEWLRR